MNPSYASRRADLATGGIRSANGTLRNDRMRDLEIDAMLLTTEPQVRYFSGFLTQFWNSPTRPWFLLVPLEGKPIAVIPSIGVAGMQLSWIDDIRSWSSPQPGDDGISLLLEVINELPAVFRTARCDHWESRVSCACQCAISNACKDELGTIEVVDCAQMMLQLCSVKSDAEIEKIRYVCELASDSFNALPELIRSGPERT